MAEPIPLEIPARDPRQELYVRLQNAPMEHAAALLDGYELLQSLHDSGILDMLRGAVGAGDKIINRTVKMADSPEAIRLTRNLMVLAQFTSSLDPELLKSFMHAIPEAIEQTHACEKKPPGFWGLLNKFRGKDLRRGLVLINALLEALGRSFCRKPPTAAHHERQ